MEPTKIHNVHIRYLEEQRQRMIISLATLLHETWRNGRYNTETTSYIPRIKITVDSVWRATNDGQDTVDIANTPFDNLPSDWQEENLLSAKVAIEKMEDILNLIHDNWLDRNDKHASLEQKVQYSRLSSDEKLKDIVVLEEAIKIIKRSIY